MAKAMNPNTLKLLKAIQAMTDEEYNKAIFYDGDDVYIRIDNETYYIDKNPDTDSLTDLRLSSNL